jgi:Spy/CpxP family protein refolding chaperone
MHGGKWGGDGGGIHALLLRGITLMPDQQQKVQAIRDANKAQFRDLFQQLHTARQALADALLASGPVDQATLDADAAQIASLRKQLLALELTTTVAIRNVLTQDQLNQIAARHAKMRELRAEMRDVMNGASN